MSQPGWSVYYTAWSCEKLATFYANSTALVQAYPACTSLDKWAAVPANFNEKGENVGAVFDLTFGMALWLALVMHAIGVESICKSASGLYRVVIV